MTTGSVLAERYEIIEELGKGGMGKVYKALDREINEKIAVKIIRPEIATNKKIIQRFQNELKMARTISHRNVCRMHDLGKDRDTRFITMEYVTGEDLKKSLRRMGPLTIRKAISLGRQICQGLSEAHRLGVIHRDLKPHNIMIDREGSVKIMDFGIALSGEVDGITDSNIIVGTPQYLSPEQVEGKKVDQRSDIYSLGVILFETVTGKVPFDGDTTLSIAVKHKTEIPRDPKELNAQIPEEFSRLILKCMEKDPEKRYQTVNELILELDIIEEQFPTTRQIIQEEKSSIIRNIGNKIKPRRKSVFIGVIFIVAIIAVIFFWSLLSREQPLSSEPGRLSIAILYFENDTGEVELDHWKKALSTLLIDYISQFKQIEVRSGDAIFYILSKLDLIDADVYSSQDLKEIATFGRVSHLLVGSYAKAGDHFRIIGQLYDGETGELIARERVDGEGEKSMFSMANEMSRKIIPYVGSSLADRGDVKDSTIIGMTDENPQAYRYYQLGRYYQRKYMAGKNEEDFAASVDMYEKALEIIPDYALAYWGLGDAYENHFNTTKESEYFDLMLLNYKKAYEIDPNLAGANAGLGWYYFYNGNNEEAYKFYKRSLEIEPNSAEVNFNVGSFYLSIGMLNHAIKFYSRAIDLDYFQIRAHILRIRSLYRLGRYEEGIEFLDELLKIEPYDLSYKLLRARFLIMQGEYARAEKELNGVEEIDPDNIDSQFTSALMFAKMGDKDEALRRINNMPIYFGSYLISTIYSLLGMTEEAIEIIEMGIENGFQEIKIYLYSYPILMNSCYSNLLDNVRFMKIVEEERMKYEEKLLKYEDIL
ncbi:MAG: protein kinase [Candidatus Aminicenantes bacterium]